MAKKTVPGRSRFEAFLRSLGESGELRIRKPARRAYGSAVLGLRRPARRAEHGRRPA